VGGASARDGRVTENEITKAITEALAPWSPQLRQIERGKRAGEIEAKSRSEVLSEISEKVGLEILRFRTSMVPDFFGRSAIKKTRQDARTLIESIDHLSKLLSAKTLSPELLLRLGHHTNLKGAPADLANMPIPRLFDVMQEIRGICKVADHAQPQADQVKLWCALTAIRLILQFSETRPSAGSLNTPYCRIASLFYQGVTGKEQAIRRVCQEVLRPYQTLLPR
jgi:hypothetical protein